MNQNIKNLIALIEGGYTELAVELAFSQNISKKDIQKHFAILDKMHIRFDIEYYKKEKYNLELKRLLNKEVSYTFLYKNRQITGKEILVKKVSTCLPF